MKLDRWINKYLFIYIIIAVVAAFTVAYVYLAYAGKNWDIKIKTLSGNPEVMKNVKISGALIDYGNSILKFSFNKDKAVPNLVKSTKDVKELEYSYRWDSWDRLTTDTAEYTINFMDSGMNVRITRRLLDENKIYRSFEQIDMNTGYRSNQINDYYDPYNDIGSSSSNSNQNSGAAAEKQGITININSYTNIMQEVNGKLYFILPKLKDHSGDSGLFIAEEFSQYNNKGKANKLAEIPLNRGENEMIALGKTDNKLFLIRSNSGNLSIQPFNIEKGVFEDEYTDNIDNFKPEQMYAIYPSPGYISIVMGGRDIYTYSVKDAIQRVSAVKGHMEKETVRQQNMLYTDNHLYIAEQVNIWPEEYDQNQRYQKPDEFIYISAYNASGTLVFKGELDAGQNDDNIRMIKYNERLNDRNTEGYISYRTFSKITLSLPDEIKK